MRCAWASSPARSWTVLLVNGKSEAGFGAGAFTYMNTLIGERITGELADPFTGNRHTERGHELEGAARILYEDREEVKPLRLASSSIMVSVTHPTLWCSKKA